MLEDKKQIVLRDMILLTTRGSHYLILLQIEMGLKGLFILFYMILSTVEYMLVAVFLKYLETIFIILSRVSLSPCNVCK